MELRRFGITARTVPVIGQGTWFLERQDLVTAVAALQRGIELGMTHIDTAELYGEGFVEEMVAMAIAGRRDQVFLVSKVLPHNASRTGTIAACERSLARLRTDRLDCLLLHWRGDEPLAETFAGLAQLLRAGKILSWGVSNFDRRDLEESWALVGRSRGPGDLVCNQVLYHLRERASERLVLPFCEAHDLALVGYSPLGHGAFPDLSSPEGQILEEIAARHMATARQVALRFLVRRPPLFTIPKASTPAHAEENARAGDLHLTPDELRLIDEAFAPGPPPRELPTL